MQKELELYEVLYLLNPNFSKKEIENKIEFYRNFLTKKGSQVMVQNRGKRNLSYSVKGFDTANYIQMLYIGNKKLINTLDITIKRDESILRHLTMKIDQPLES